MKQRLISVCFFTQKKDNGKKCELANNEIMERAIVYLDMMDYFIECERLVNSSLKNIPLIIGGNK
ncbi:MAG: hypothetical protein ABF242_09650, partial [Flavobacteriales bacterium]